LSLDYITEAVVVVVKDAELGQRVAAAVVLRKVGDFYMTVSSHQTLITLGTDDCFNHPPATRRPESPASKIQAAHGASGRG
jgi:acyl-CoA synthetase (AMP-forming)/AMP-acid ligase II